MSEKLRWGVLGCGWIVPQFVKGVQVSKNGELYAMGSRSLAKAQKTAAEHGAQKAYGSYEDLLADPNVDAVYVALPNFLHKEWTIKAANAGKHVLCEKPVAMTAEDAREMIDVCKQKAVVLAEAFMYRHHPRFDDIKSIIASGKIGALRSLHSVFTYNLEGDYGNVRCNKTYGGGGIYDIGCYSVSAARLIVGAEPVAVTAVTQYSDDYDGCDMMTTALLEFPNSVGVSMECGMWGASRDKMEIVCATGVIQIPHAFRNDTDESFSIITDSGAKLVEQPHLNTYALEVDDFAQAVWGKQPLRFATEDAYTNMKVMDALLKSGKERKRIEL